MASRSGSDRAGGAQPGSIRALAFLSCRRWWECSAALAGRVPGRRRRRGAAGRSVVTALLLGGDCVMLGSTFAGTLETPGETIRKSVLLPESQKVVKIPFKVLRGMASLDAITDRLDLEDADILDVQTLGAEGLEVSVPAGGSARPIIREMSQHLCSAISYGRGEQPGRAQAPVSISPRALPHQAVRGRPARIVRAVAKGDRRGDQSPHVSVPLP